ncbi:DNA polymerase III subunit chi [Rhodopila sp.]|jgi:DNA polymerase-3 subunit chi|uniref:DNA polymerase III subunit chi n=1 Tax=Rhodopila sp. TaxID=2480087 RepID=UPI002C1BD257|nr:DNA polymerase III subunit chi [Rhodopila sp.]HVZ10636.1 DNA polymerase III subunit chi [Rhodopila sp.]
MTGIGFYHLTRSTLEQALPRLLQRTLAAGQRALVLTPDAATRTALDEALWRQPVWLPHGTEADGDADLQPIWLSTEPVAANGARFLFLTHGASTDRIGAFDRAFDLFDGTREDAVQAARQRWKAARDAGHAVTYWQQTEAGWQQKA